MRSWMMIISVAVGSFLVGALFSQIVTFPNRDTRQAQLVVPTVKPATPQAQALTPIPQYQPPPPLPPETLSEQQQREELMRIRDSLCQDLQAIAGIILNIGILEQVPPRISEITGLSIDKLEATETQACQPTTQAQTTMQLLENVRDIEWLVKVHLIAVDDITLSKATLRPINATGSFAAFLELHDVIVLEMRKDLAALSADTATLDDARRLGTFWREVVIPHAKAEEGTLFLLARSLGVPDIAQSADLVESEHKTIEDKVGQYMRTLQAVEQGQEQLGQLTPIARDLRGRVELHFGKEEQSVIRPLQERITDDQFRPVVVEQDKAIGMRAREHGWKGLPSSR